MNVSTGLVLTMGFDGRRSKYARLEDALGGLVMFLWRCRAMTKAPGEFQSVVTKLARAECPRPTGTAPGTVQNRKSSRPPTLLHYTDFGERFGPGLGAMRVGATLTTTMPNTCSPEKAKIWAAMSAGESAMTTEPAQPQDWPGAGGTNTSVDRKPSSNTSPTLRPMRVRPAKMSPAVHASTSVTPEMTKPENWDDQAVASAGARSLLTAANAQTTPTERSMIEPIKRLVSRGLLMSSPLPSSNTENNTSDKNEANADEHDGSGGEAG